MEFKKSDILLESVRKLLRRDAEANLRRALLKSHPSEIAAVIRQLTDDEGLTVFRQLRGTQTEAETFVELEGPFLNTYLKHFPDDLSHVAMTLQLIPEDEAAGILADVDHDEAQQILSLMESEVKEEVAEILDYDEDTCGRIMAVNVFSLNQDLTAKGAIEKIQNSDDLESLFYIYVVDDYENLVGVVSLRQILQVPKQAQLKSFMKREVIHVRTTQSQEAAAELIEEYNYVSLPVLDDEGKLEGVVTVDDILDYIRDEAQDEVLKLAGVESEAIDDFGFVRAFFSRAVWYAALFLGGLLCSEIILLFFPFFPREVALICFAPLAMRVGGSIAIQTSTLVDQSLLNLDIEKGRSKRALLGQNLITLIVGIAMAACTGVYSWYRFDREQDFAFGMSVGLICVTIFSLVIGTALPLFFDRFKINGARASSRFIHFMMDVLSLLLFFYAYWFMRTQVL